MKIRWDGIEWGQSEITKGTDMYFYYFCWANWLPTSERYWGVEYIYYDSNHKTFGFWFCNISWSTRWTKGKP